MTSAKPDGLFSSPEKRNLILSLLLVLATLALYNPVSRHPFVNYDDDRYVTDNAHVRAGLHWETIRWAFTTFDEANWHPSTWISHALDCQVFGLKPAGHHYVSLLLHALNVVLLFWVLRKATGAVAPSLMVAALFAVHPVNVESVAWIAERKNILSMMFFLLALAAYGWYARKPSGARYLLVAGLFACGLMSKPMVITLPFVLLLWDYWPLQRAISLAKSALEKVPLFALSVASAIVTLKAQRASDAIGSITQYPLDVRFGNAVISYASYLGKAIWPVYLAPMYPLRADSISGFKVIGATVLAIFITALVLMFRQKQYLLVGWFWFLGTLIPMIGLVQVGRQAMADRYAYLPFIGLFIAVSFGLGEILGAKRAAFAVVGVAVLLAFSAMTYRQLNYWADNVTLWFHTLQVTKDNFIAEDNLGGALIEAGRIDDAMPHFRAAAALEPTDPMSRMNLAADAQRHGEYALAVQNYKTLIAATRDARFRATALTDLGYCYRELGNAADARQSFREAVRLRPRTLRAWVGLGLVDYKSADYAAAAADFNQALAIQPWDLGYYLLARALDKAGQPQESQVAMQQAKQNTENFDDLQKSAEALLSK